MPRKLSGVCVVRKGAEEHVLTQYYSIALNFLSIAV